jgi:hypothetical protein
MLKGSPKEGSGFYLKVNSPEMAELIALTETLLAGDAGRELTRVEFVNGLMEFYVKNRKPPHGLGTLSSSPRM